MSVDGLYGSATDWGFMSFWDPFKQRTCFVIKMADILISSKLTFSPGGNNMSPKNFDCVSIFVIKGLMCNINKSLLHSFWGEKKDIKYCAQIRPVHGRLLTFTQHFTYWETGRKSKIWWITSCKLIFLRWLKYLEMRWKITGIMGDVVFILAHIDPNSEKLLQPRNIGRVQKAQNQECCYISPKWFPSLLTFLYISYSQHFINKWNQTHSSC